MFGVNPTITMRSKHKRPVCRRLGLSADDLGKLLGVSAQSIYNWEQDKARPSAELLAKVAALRAIGKRDAKSRLAQLFVATKRATPKS
jgi:DNA-binding XRE family transcriptional regulator